MVRWSLCEGRLNIKKRKKQSVPGKMVVVVRWSFYGRSFWPGGTVILTSRGSQGHTVRQQNGLAPGNITATRGDPRSSAKNRKKVNSGIVNTINF